MSLPSYNNNNQVSYFQLGSEANLGRILTSAGHTAQRIITHLVSLPTFPHLFIIISSDLNEMPSNVCFKCIRFHVIVLSNICGDI